MINDKPQCVLESNKRRMSILYNETCYHRAEELEHNVWQCGNVWVVSVTSAYFWQLSGHSVCSNNTLFMLYTCEKRIPLTAVYWAQKVCVFSMMDFWDKISKMNWIIFDSRYKLNLPDIKCHQGKKHLKMLTLIISVMTHLYPWYHEMLSRPPGCSKNSIFQK